MTECCKNITLSRLFHVEHQFRMILNSSSHFVLKIHSVEKENIMRTFIQPVVVVNVSRETIKKIKLFFIYSLTQKTIKYKLFLMIYLKILINNIDKSNKGKT